MGMTDWKEVDELLLILAKYCIAKDYYRKGNKYHHFTMGEVRIINKHYKGDHPFHLDEGYMFLDNKGGKEGMIRLCFGGGNPKWSFWEDSGDVIVVDYA